MPSIKSAGLFFILAGLALFAIGIIAEKTNLSWIGKLPGDFSIERPGFRLYAPLATMLLFSILVNLGLFLFKKMFK